MREHAHKVACRDAVQGEFGLCSSLQAAGLDGRSLSLPLSFVLSAVSVTCELLPSALSLSFSQMCGYDEENTVFKSPWSGEYVHPHLTMCEP